MVVRALRPLFPCDRTLIGPIGLAPGRSLAKFEVLVGNSPARIGSVKFRERGSAPQTRIARYTLRPQSQPAH